MHAYAICIDLFPWPDRQAAHHASESDDQATSMPCPNEIGPRDCRERDAKTTERDRSSHGSPRSATGLLAAARGLHLPACMHSQSKDELPDKSEGLPEKLKSGMHICMASPGLAMTGLVQSPKKAATACDRPAGLSELNRRSGGARPARTDRSTCM